MSRKDELFELINTLTPNEKRYFKLTSDLQKGEKPYLVLFDRLSRMESYDDEALKKWWEGQDAKSPLYRVKNYLYNSLLKTLPAFRQVSTDIVLYDRLREIEFLYSKHLYEQCFKQVNKAIELSTALDNKLMTLKLYSWLNLLHSALQYQYADREEFDLIQEKCEQLTQGINRDISYRATLSRLTYSLRMGGPLVGDDTHQLLKEMEKDEYMQQGNDEIGFESAILKLRCQEWYHIARNELAKALQCLLDIVELYEGNSTRKGYEIIDYSHILENALLLASATNNEDLLNQVLDKIENAEGLPEPQQHKIQVRKYYASLLFYTSRREYVTAAKLIDEENKAMEPLLQEVEFTLRQSIHHMYIKVFHGIGQHEKALEWVSLQMHDAMIKQNPIDLLLAHLYEIVLHFDMANYQLLESILLAFKRKAKKMSYYDVLNQIFVSGLNKCVRMGSNLDRKPVFEQMKRDIEKAKERGEVAPELLINFDFEVWLESKITGRSFLQILQEKALQPS